jgi:hypothetical protein
LTLRRTVLLGTPLVLTILLAFHPSPYDDVAGELLGINASVGHSGEQRTYPFRSEMANIAKGGCSLGSQRGAERPAPTRKAVTSLAKRLSVTVPP